MQNVKGWLLLAVLVAQANAFLPVVLMHGTASTPWFLRVLTSQSFQGITASTATVSHVVDMLKLHLPGVYVKNVEIGDGPVDSVFWSMDKQVGLYPALQFDISPTLSDIWYLQLDQFCSQLAADPKLAGGINLMGFSQGNKSPFYFVCLANFDLNRRHDNPRLHRKMQQPSSRKLCFVGSPADGSLWCSEGLFRFTPFLFLPSPPAHIFRRLAT